MRQQQKRRDIAPKFGKISKLIKKNVRKAGVIDCVYSHLTFWHYATQSDNK